MPRDLKLAHYGVLLVIMALTEARIEATANAIASIALMRANSVTRALNDLFQLGLVRRDQIVASHGKGHQYRYFALTGVAGLLPFVMVRRGSPRRRAR
jgi:predicted transcriptional regulator